MKIKNLLLLLLVPFHLYAYNFNQPISGDAPEIEYDVKKVTPSPFVDSSISDSVPAKKSKTKKLPSPYLPGTDVPNLVPQKSIKPSGQTVQGEFEDSESLIEYSYRERHREHQDKGNQFFSFQYIQDNYDYKDNGNLYQTIFEDSTGSQTFGTMLFSGAYYVNRKYVDTAVGINLGVGYQYGYGEFTDDSSRSDTRFSLLTVPFDLALHLEVPVSNWFKVACSGGPSALFLFQNRSDRSSGEGGKRVRQFGYGYFASADFKISLSNLFPKIAFDQYQNYDVTKMYFTMGIRTVDYGNFKKEDLTISGQSFTAGFSFEYF